MLKNKTILNYIFIILGTTMFALGVTLFFEPNSLITGGVSGISIIVRDLSERWLPFTVPLWLTNALLNLPLFVLGTKILGMKFLKRTLFATAYLSLAYFLLESLPFFQIGGSDLFLASVFGGVVCGTGIGIVFRGRATTGGSDILASIIHKFKRHVAISKIMFISDFFVISLGLFLYGFTKGMYAVIAVFISSRCINSVLEGLSFAKAALIISDRSGEISERIMAETERGGTFLSGRGMYTGNEKNVILCVLSSKEIVVLKRLVYETDRAAFVIVADVREVLGEGFQTIS